jgi:hypothetical protein
MTTEKDIREWNKHRDGKKLTPTEIKNLTKLVNVFAKISNYGYRKYPKRKGYRYEDRMIKLAREHMGEWGY